MKEISNKKLKIGEKGDSVTLRVPDIDRRRGDFSNVMVKVIDIDSKGLITLGSKYGIINGKFTRGEVVPCFKSFLTDDEVPLNTISVRELARKESNGTRQGFFNVIVKLNVQKDASVYQTVICNSKCHQSQPTCDNK